MLDLEDRHQKIQYFKKILDRNNYVSNKTFNMLQASIRRAEEKKAKGLFSLLKAKRNYALHQKNVANIAIIKPVGSKCNLDCDYCYYSGKDFFLKNPLKEHLSVMNENLLRKIISEMLAINLGEVCFIWHGGEPLLAGINFYKKVVELQEEMKRNEQEVKNIIQTNATLINETYLSFFRENQFRIGISLDGTKEIHNIHRKYLSGKGSFSSVMDSLILLKKQDIEYGAISVVSSKHKDNPKNRLNFFVKNDIFSIVFEPCVDETLLLSPDDYANFMINLFEAWLNLDEPRIKIRFFEEVIQGLIGYTPEVCTMSGMCRNILCFESNGNILPCDQPFDKSYKYGNILENDLSTILQGEKHQTFIQSDIRVQRECSSCKWFFLCHGGCPYLRTVKNKEHNGKDYFCEGYQKIFTHIINRIDHILESI